MEPATGFLGKLALSLIPALLGGLLRPGQPKQDPMGRINALAQHQLQGQQQRQATGTMAAQGLGRGAPTRFPPVQQQTYTGYQEDPLERLKRELAQLQNTRMNG